MANVAALVADYKSTEEALAPLMSADGSLAQASANADNLQRSVGLIQGELGRNQAECTKLERRIHRNENPRFFHYLIFNRKARAERFRGELGVKRGLEAEQQQDLTQKNEQLAGLRQVESQARGAVSNKRQLEARKGQLFDQVVASQPPTVHLQELQNRKASQSGLLASERGLQAAMQQSEQLAQRGIQQFEAARQTLQRAEQENQAALRANDQERFAQMREGFAERRGDGFGADNAEFQAECAERRERMMQSMRDQHINQSCQQASDAYRSMHAALFSSFPQEARQRYPQLCMQIGRTPFPQLQGASGFQTGMADLFGPVGAMMNEWGTENKIMQNLSVVQQCESIARQQHQLIVAVCSAIGGGIAQMDQNLAQISSGIEAERRRIFGEVMAANGHACTGGAQAGGYPAAMQPPVAQGMMPTPAPAPAPLVQAVASAAPQMMVVTCPEGAVPGTSIQIQAPDGRMVAVEVPAGIAPGAQFQVQL